MSLFLRNKKLKGLVICGVVRRLYSRLGEQETTFASFSKLEVRQRMRENALHC